MCGEGLALVNDSSSKNSPQLNPGGPQSSNQKLQQLIVELTRKGTEASLEERDLILKALQSGMAVDHILNRPAIGQKCGSFEYRGYHITWATTLKEKNETTEIKVVKLDDPDTVVFEETCSNEEGERGRPLPLSAESAVDIARCWVLMQTEISF